MSKVAVICFWYGEWPEDRPELGSLYVQRLHNSVLRNSLIRPLDFIVFADREKYQSKGFLKGMDVLPIPLEYEMLKWNLKKLLMFHPQSGLRKYDWVICLDLDMVILGSLDFLTNHRWCGLTACAGAYQPDQLGGSIIGFQPNSPWCGRLTNSLHIKRKWWESMTGGSERKFYRIFFGMDPEMTITWQGWFPGKILSYKTDGGPKGGCSIVRFHGRPRPHEVSEKCEWVKENWR